MKLTFLGGAQTVTGSKFLVESENGSRVLIDCGLFQGLKNLRLKNWEKFPVDPKSIDAVILTHAHIDHSGYLPKLVREGFQGKVYSSPATKALAEILLLDSARLKEEDAEYANRKKFSKHKPAKPLYTEADAQKALNLFQTVSFHTEVEIRDIKFEFRRAGHILGAASVVIKADDKTTLFSGDLGRVNDMLMPSPEPPIKADCIIMESTYGKRIHEKLDPLEELRRLVSETKKKGSVLMVPSFAVGRIQTLIYCFNQVFKKYPNLKIPIYLNSPMATDVTELYETFYDDHKLNPEETHELINSVEYVHSASESKELNQKSGPMIILAGSGMLTGGRILHHLRAFGDDSKNTILLVGYQAVSTRGADLVKGAKSLKVHGHYIPISAKVKQLDIFSAHAGQDELINWLASAEKESDTVFLIHGDPEESDCLRRKLTEKFSSKIYVAEHMQSITV